MKNYLIVAILFVSALSPAFAQASLLTTSQTNAIVQLLQSFGADQSVINNVKASLSDSPVSNGVVFETYVSSPSLTIVFPTVIALSQPKDLTVYGSNFKSGMSVVYTGSSDGSFVPTYTSPTKFTFSSSRFPIGQYSFFVKNTDGKSSGSLAFEVAESAFKSLYTSVPTGSVGSVSPLTSPTTTTPPPTTPPIINPHPPGGVCSGTIITPATVTTYTTGMSLKWVSTDIVFTPTTSAHVACPAGTISSITNCSSENTKCDQLAPDPTITYEYTCKNVQTTTGPVNGTCGVSACGLFTSAPATGLCTTGTASTVSGIGPFTWTCTGSGGGSSVSCWANKNGTGNPPPPPISCGAGEVFGSGDIAWNLKTIQLWPVPPITGTGDFGRAVQFVADSASYPKGVEVVTINESLGTLPQPNDYVISACPHSFTPVGGSAACTLTGAGSYGGPLYLRFGPATKSYDCSLTPGGTYYINFRNYFTPRGFVTSQFTSYDRAIPGFEI